ncbi:hypothetical protein F441_12819 [Phytophthora nicotianae CJ01A1]|uniref:Uncharacterized protein n=2 Tax=Phytophthora nicotianae TaxID=4792 RepID=V9ERR9_PHYNI|nr:hypothetical protein F443_12860 [Phytophthora nicotianae P1569]ETP11686.1 hypothetical protein F441_12819 [Phytophthora nicotianae CJ01A1]
MPRSPASTIYHLLHGLRVVLFLEERSVRDKLLRGAVCAALSEFNISRNSIKKFCWYTLYHFANGKPNTR